MSFAYRGTQRFLTYMLNQVGCLLKVGNAYLSQASGFTSVFGGVCVAHRFSFLSCFIFVFFCLRSLLCVPNVASISELSILYCPFRFH